MRKELDEAVESMYHNITQMNQSLLAQGRVHQSTNLKKESQEDEKEEANSSCSEHSANPSSTLNQETQSYEKLLNQMKSINQQLLSQLQDTTGTTKGKQEEIMTKEESRSKKPLSSPTLLSSNVQLPLFNRSNLSTTKNDKQLASPLGKQEMLITERKGVRPYDTRTLGVQTEKYEEYQVKNVGSHVTKTLSVGKGTQTPNHFHNQHEGTSTRDARFSSIQCEYDDQIASLPTPRTHVQAPRQSKSLLEQQQQITLQLVLLDQAIQSETIPYLDHPSLGVNRHCTSEPMLDSSADSSHQQ